MLRLNSLSQAGTSRYLGPDGTAGAAGGHCRAGSLSAGSGPRGIASGRHWVRAAWFRAADLAAGRRLGGPAPAVVCTPHPRRVWSLYGGCRGPDFPAGVRDSGLRQLQNGFPLCSPVASQRDASRTGCGTDCQWKPRVQSGQQAMRLAPFLLPIEQSRPRRSPGAGRPGAAPRFPGRPLGWLVRAAAAAAAHLPACRRSAPGNCRVLPRSQDRHVLLTLVSRHGRMTMSLATTGNDFPLIIGTRPVATGAAAQSKAEVPAAVALPSPFAPD
jgi:hypothetical protein